MPVVMAVHDCCCRSSCTRRTRTTPRTSCSTAGVRMLFSAHSRKSVQPHTLRTVLDELPELMCTKSSEQLQKSCSVGPLMPRQNCIARCTCHAGALQLNSQCNSRMISVSKPSCCVYIFLCNEGKCIQRWSLKVLNHTHVI